MFFNLDYSQNLVKGNKLSVSQAFALDRIRSQKAEYRSQKVKNSGDHFQKYSEF